MRKLDNEELGRKSIADFKLARKIPLIIILDDIRSLNNIGSVFRTADAFLVEKIILCGITATPPNKEIHKTALGATETVSWEYNENVVAVVDELKSDNIEVYAVEQVENATYLQDFDVDTNKKYAVIFGNEVFGVSQDAVTACHGTIEIPQEGTKHSLNISVSAGIVIWDFYKKYKAVL